MSVMVTAAVAMIPITTMAAIKAPLVEAMLSRSTAVKFPMGSGFSVALLGGNSGFPYGEAASNFVYPSIPPPSGGSRQ
jgi:hypothetical protein